MQLGLNGPQWRFDGSDTRAGEMLVEGVTEVFCGVFPVINKELPLSLEVAQLQYQVSGDRHRACCRDRSQLRTTPLEEEVTIANREAR
jgi:hypothetical protein